MSKFEAGLTTFFPRNEELISATRELDRGRRSPSEVDAIVGKWTDEVFGMESAMGLSWATGGHLAWQDIFRPFVESSVGVVPGPLTRWFETNTFFRRPVIERLPKGVPGAVSKRIPRSRDGLAVILPGPWTFVGLSENRTALDEATIAGAISSLLTAAIVELKGAGVGQFLIHEPLGVVMPPSDSQEEKAFLTLYQPLGEALKGTRNLLWTYFGDGAPILPLLSKLPVGGIGVDLSETRAADLKSFDPAKSLGLGCLDARTSLPEDPVEIASLAKDLGDRLKPQSLILGPGVPLDLLPWEAAKNKLNVLPQTLGLLKGGK